MTSPSNFELLTQQAFAMRDGLSAAASKMEETELTGTSGGVTITLTAAGSMRAIRIDPRMIHDVASLEGHIILAHQQATAATREVAENMLAPLRDLVARATATE